MLRVVVMGVAGSGKTTVGGRLAERWQARFVDADSVHPPANVAKMAAGIPLDDEDRAPWLRRLHDELESADAIVVTCSALKRRYRDVLRAAGGVTFVFLDVGPEVAAERVGGRRDHFMKTDMVESQFAALEPPRPDEHDIVTVDGSRPVDVIVAEITDPLAG